MIRISGRRTSKKKIFENLYFQKKQSVENGLAYKLQISRSDLKSVTGGQRNESGNFIKSCKSVN